MEAKTWWYADVAPRDREDGRTLTQVLTVASEQHPDGSRHPADEIDVSNVLCVATFWDDKLYSIQPTSALTGPNTPKLWFVEVPAEELTALMAFTGHGVRTGAVLEADEFNQIGITDKQQMAAIQFEPKTGKITQTYVQPQHRRQGIGNGIIFVAGLLNIVRGNARLYGTNFRTADGEAHRNNSIWRGRAADLKSLAPPMTPSV